MSETMGQQEKLNEEREKPYCYLVTFSSGPVLREWLADPDSLSTTDGTLINLPVNASHITFYELHTGRPVLISGPYHLEGISKEEYDELIADGLHGRPCQECGE